MTGNPPLLRTVISVSFKGGTTVGQINALLQEIGGRIVLTLEKTALLYVRIPDPGSPIGLEVVVNRVKSKPFVAFVGQKFLSSATALPRSVSNVPSSEFFAIDHHVAVGAAAAWNAIAALTSRSLSERPIIVIADIFGNGSAVIQNGTGLVPVGGGTFAMPITLVPDEHGYHVTGILAGRFDDQGSSTISRDVAGIFPASRLSSVSGGAPIEADLMDLIQSALPQFLDWTLEPIIAAKLRRYTKVRRNVVLNTSFGVGFGSKITLEQRNIAKFEWLQLIRGGFVGGGCVPAECLVDEDRYFHSAAAGNVDDGESDFAKLADRGMGWNAAALDGELHNTAVVENRAAFVFAAEGKGRVHSGCLFSDSYTDGNISAIGGKAVDGLIRGVVSYNWTGTTIEGRGTSMAAPQVAGLAAYLWSLAPNLTGRQVFSRIRDNSRPGLSGCQVNGQPVIDAYATVLTADTEETLAGAKVRLAILDTNTDNRFDEVDLINFKVKLTSPTPTSARDYSRYDLNGDGFTGGLGTARFSLDMDYKFGTQASNYSTISRNIAGVNQTFDETKLTDSEILCYYAHGKLYTGSPATRDSLLQGICGRPPVCSSSVKYKMTPLANTVYHGGEHYERFTGLNNAGQVVGALPGGYPTLPAKWGDNGSIEILPDANRCSQVGGGRGIAYAVNDKGQVVGRRCAGVEEIATLWEPNGLVVDLWSAEPGLFGNAAATLINNFGEILGERVQGLTRFQVYRDAKGRLFENVHEFIDTQFNNSGQVLGWKNVSPPSQRVRHVLGLGPPLGPRVIIDLPVGCIHLGAGQLSLPYLYLNDKGQVAASVSCADDGPAFPAGNWAAVYERGVWRRLFMGAVTGLNNFGDIVGVSFHTSGSSKSVLVRDGTIVELDSCLPISIGTNSLLVKFINDKGQIAAQISGFFIGAEWYLLSPVAQ